MKIVFALIIYTALCLQSNTFELQKFFPKLNENKQVAQQFSSEHESLKQKIIDSVNQIVEVAQGLIQQQLQQNSLIQSTAQAYILQSTPSVNIIQSSLQAITPRSLEEIKSIAKTIENDPNLNNATPLQQQIIREDSKGNLQSIEPSNESFQFIKITLEINILLFFSFVLLGCLFKICRRKKYTEKFEQYPQRADSVELEEEV